MSVASSSGLGRGESTAFRSLTGWLWTGNTALREVRQCSSHRQELGERRGPQTIRTGSPLSTTVGRRGRGGRQPSSRAAGYTRSCCCSRVFSRQGSPSLSGQALRAGLWRGAFYRNAGKGLRQRTLHLTKDNGRPEVWLQSWRPQAPSRLQGKRDGFGVAWHVCCHLTFVLILGRGCRSSCGNLGCAHTVGQAPHASLLHGGLGLGSAERHRWPGTGPACARLSACLP